MAVRVAVKFIISALLVASTQGSVAYSSFSYGVSDPNTGDFKDQHEQREGGNVVGNYSLIDADGTKRVVEYSASDATGFRAIVHKEPAGVSSIQPNEFGYGGPVLGLAPRPLEYTGAASVAPLTHPAEAGILLPHETSHGTSSNLLTHGVFNSLSSAQQPILTHGPYGYGFNNPLTGIPDRHPVGGYDRHLAPAVSHYSHTIIHNARPSLSPYAGVLTRLDSSRKYGVQTRLVQENTLNQSPSSPVIPFPQQEGSIANTLPHSGVTAFDNGLNQGAAAHGVQFLPSQSHIAQFLPQPVLPPHTHNGLFDVHSHDNPSVSLLQGGAPITPISPIPQGGWSTQFSNVGYGLIYVPQGPTLVDYTRLPFAPHLAHGRPAIPQNGLNSPLAQNSLASYLPPHGLIPLDQRRPDVPVNQNDLTSSTDRNLSRNSPKSPFFNGPLAQGTLPKSELSKNPASKRNSSRESSSSSLERSAKKARNLDVGNLGTNDSEGTAW